MVSAPAAARPVSSIIPVVDDVARLRLVMVNVYLVGEPGDLRRGWVLVDAGMPRTASAILRAAEERYGADTPPRAMVLTHGHFDHVGALHELMEAWPGVPIYAHELEMPYLKGRSPYPPPDPTVGGGAFTRLSPLDPKGPIDLGERVFALPTDGSIPMMPGWQWVPTPGHSPGHVSLFRESDRTLLAGDAFVTTQQESFFSVLTQRQELHGPPMYFTCDWDSARESVRRLWDLRPAVAATGHGVPMRGTALATHLRELADRFDELARPSHGRYVDQPAITDRSGIVALPPKPADPLLKIAAVAGVAVAAMAIMKFSRKSDEQVLEEDEQFIEEGV
jgi:glyoxylase-like metal-dependent hydrolase (beta-lactamase superfamily II)